jgi:TetR/AcrR family transcriptional regulator, transcriptional repressor for nem operon
MRYEKGRKDATHKRIVNVASKRFRKDGIASVGVARLMADASLTHGGFYAHFNSKEDLVREALIDALDRTRGELGRVTCADGAGIEALVRTYLSPWHRDRPDHGCAAASLVSEVARLSRPTRVTFTERIEALINLIAEQLPMADQRARQKAAIGIFSMMMGALQLARAVADKNMSDQILQSGVEAALALAGKFNT